MLCNFYSNAIQVAMPYDSYIEHSTSDILIESERTEEVVERVLSNCHIWYRY